MLAVTPAALRCRRITDADLDAVAALLSRGFRFRPKRFWLRGLKRQADRPRPENYPPYGYLLDSNGVAVGAVLMFFSNVTTRTGTVLRCNLSSWYVEPEFRNFGSLLVTTAIRDKNVTYLNVSPAPTTWPTIEAQGFLPFCRGEMFSIPALSRPAAQTSIQSVGADTALPDLAEAELLTAHARLGCLSLMLRSGGESFPFVFQRRRVLKRLLPCYRLIYCRDLGDFVRFAGNLGRFLLKRGTPLVVVDANAPIAGLPGHYTQRQGRKYARGPHVPKLGDLAYTEGVFFDF